LSLVLNDEVNKNSMLTKHLILIALVPALFCEYCYDSKCQNYDGTYIDCDQGVSWCTEGDYWRNDATCTYNSYPSQSLNGDYCDDDETCYNDWYTGEACCSTVFTSSCPLDGDVDEGLNRIKRNDNDDSIDKLASLSIEIVVVFVWICIAGLVLVLFYYCPCLTWICKNVIK
jgi:hypothetical protein